MQTCFLGLDTSNYTTSLSIADHTGKIIANLKKPVYVKCGEQGMRQSEVVFSHIKNYPILLDSFSSMIKDYHIQAIGVSNAPRNVPDSYMPCFMVGLTIAKMLGASMQIPVYEFSHQQGHVMAAAYSSNNINLLTRTFLAYHISGGTTEILNIVPNADSILKIEKLGGTDDISMGQAIDRVGVYMGLQFPCGVEMEKLAKEHLADQIPPIKISITENKFHLSGLENLAKKLYDDTLNSSLVSNYVFKFIEKNILQMTSNLREEYPNEPILFSGGVMSNSIIKNTLLNHFDNIYFAESSFASDNAAGVALLSKKKYEMNNI